MASRRTRVALAAAALVAMSAGAVVWLRADRSRESGPGLGDEMPAGSPGAPDEARASSLAAGGRSPRPIESPPTGATGAGGAAHPTPPAAPVLAKPVGPEVPDRAADGVAGVVFGVKGPTADAVLRMRRGRWSERMNWPRSSEPEMTIPVGSDGRFARTGLQSGEWFAEVAVPGLAPRLVGFTVGEAGAGASIEIGDAVVEGRLYDREGKAVADARVTLSRGPAEGFPLGVALEAQTTADGFFRFDGLASGAWWLVGFLGRENDPMNNRTESILVSAGATLTHDLGIPRPEPRWSGVVRTRSGKPVRGGGGSSLLLIEQAISRAHAATIDDEGRFADRFPFGTHSVAVVYLGGVEHKPIKVGDISLEGDLEKDITLPGSRLSGTIRPAAPGSLPRDQRLYWTPDGKDYHSREGVSVGADGAYVVDGMPAGRYRIEGFPLALFDARGDPPVVDMADDRPEATLDLVAKSP